MSDNIKILKNYLIYFLLMFLVCIVGISNVFADTYENIGYVNDDTYVNVSVAYTSNILPLQRESQYQLSQVQELYIEVENFIFSSGITYSLEFYTPDTPLSYASSFSVYAETSSHEPLICESAGIQYDDIKHLNFRFNCSKTVNYIKITVFNSSGGYLSDTGLFSWYYSYIRKLITSSSTEILQSQNAQIIQGQKDIINNQNQNTDKEIESQKVCNTFLVDNSYIISSGRYFNSSGVVSIGWAQYGITDYIELSTFNKIKVLSIYSSEPPHYCFYNSNKTLISCFPNNSLILNDYLNIPDGSKYVRFTIINSYNAPTFEISSCKNGNQALNDSITGLNDSLNDDDSSGATSEASEFFNSFTTNTFGLTSIITAPLNLIQSLTSSTCSELYLPLPYLNNKYLDLPCMTSIYQTHFGAFFTMYQTITYGIIAYWVCVRIFNQVKDFKNPEHDEIEVVDL